MPAERISVLDCAGLVEPMQFVVIETERPSGMVRLSLFDNFTMRRDQVAPQAFLEVELEYAAVVMAIGGSCTCVTTDRACFALYPVGSAVRLTFQADDWPFPEQWTVSRDEFNAAVTRVIP